MEGATAGGAQASIDNLLADIKKLKKRERAHVVLSVSLVFVVLAWTSTGLQNEA